MRSIVTADTARTEGSDRTGTNHPWTLFYVGPGNTVVKEEAATGFTKALKAARKIIGAPPKGTVEIRIAGNPQFVPGKFRDEFKKLVTAGAERNCFVVPVAA
jgi:hypothetical protein